MDLLRSKNWTHILTAYMPLVITIRKCALTHLENTTIVKMIEIAYIQGYAGT
ncbi:MAG: hypothetical protein ACI9J3_000713 [Parvicellaceae bacterium]|jgi:hypothetical protein